MTTHFGTRHPFKQTTNKQEHFLAGNIRAGKLSSRKLRKQKTFEARKLSKQKTIIARKLSKQKTIIARKLSKQKTIKANFG